MKAIAEFSLIPLGTGVSLCHEVIHAMGVLRIHSTVKLGTRIDQDETLEAKVKSVKEQLKRNDQEEKEN